MVNVNSSRSSTAPRVAGATLASLMARPSLDRPPGRGAKPELRVGAYLRVSTDEQAREGFSLETQLEDIRRYTRQRGWDLAQVYRDDGYSGTNEKRPAFRQMLRDIQAGKVEVIIIHRLDRLFRNITSLLRRFNEWESQDVQLISIGEQVDFTTTWGRLLLSLLGTLAQIYVEELSDRTSRGKRKRADEGYWNGRIPFGYCSGACANCRDPNGPDYCPEHGQANRNMTKIMVPHPIDAAGVVKLFEWYATGRYSARDLAEKLNQHLVTLPDGGNRRLRTKSTRKEPRNRRRFDADAVSFMLKNAIYIGMVPYYGVDSRGRKRRKPVDFSPGLHEPLISPELFDRCQAIRKARYKAPQGGPQRRRARVYLLSRLLRCGRCGAVMRSQAAGSRGHRRHICKGRLEKACDQPIASADELEAQLATCLSALQLAPKWQREVMAILAYDDGRFELERQRREAEEEWVYAQRLFQEKRLTLRELDEAGARYQRHLAQLEPQNVVGLEVDRARALMADFSQLWAALPQLERKQLLDLMLQVATVEDSQLVSLDWFPPFDRLLSGAGPETPNRQDAGR